MNSEKVVKWIFGIIDAVIALAFVIAVTLNIGHAVTGSWDVRDWSAGGEEAAVSAEHSLGYA